MSQPILALQEAQAKPKATVNLLPCRIQHNGTVDSIAPYWTPTKAQDGERTAYFRGRKLQGKTVALPEQCRGVVMHKSDEARSDRPAIELPPGDDEDEAVEAPVGTMQVTADFDEVVVWGHEAVADAAGDPYVRSIEEWLQVSDKIHSY